LPRPLFQSIFQLASAVGFVVLRIVRFYNIAISELFEDHRNFYDGKPLFAPRQKNLPCRLKNKALSPDVVKTS
ncbi:hypothetical protein, partial [Roseibacillus persicicus]|uniref:hypothetical protein n=1 Tax=Roseibacillus persicicus TaxID=454148 RepID=UPI00280D57BA